MKNRKSTRLLIETASVPWQRVAGLEARLDDAACLTLSVLPENLLPLAPLAQMTLLLTTDSAVQKLNRTYRFVDKPTNVLSFPQFLRADLSKMSRSKRFGTEPLYVGDIAVAYGTTAAEAKHENKLLLDHLTHLTIHGILHLFGFDHDTQHKAARMERLEKEIMATLGLLDPYAPLPDSKKQKGAGSKR